MTKVKKIIIASLSILVIFAITIFVVMAASQLSTRGKIQAESLTITADYENTAANFNLTFTEKDDKKDVEITIKNNTDSNTGSALHQFYQISYKTQNTDLSPAILVYYNGQFIDTLSNIISKRVIISDEHRIIPIGSSVLDTFSFVLHQSAISGPVDGKNFSVSIEAFTQNIDYSENIIVKSEADFKKAVDDINSGMLDNPTIHIANALTLTNNYVISNPAKIYTDYTLTGNITVNDDNQSSPDAILEVLGSGTISTLAVGSYYDTNRAKELVYEYATNVLKNGILASTVNIVGPYAFYGVAISATEATYTSPNLIVNEAQYDTLNYYSRIHTLTVGGTLTYDFKVVGTKTRLIDSVFYHLPDTNEAIFSDLYLPTSIQGMEATISYTSSNPDIMDNTGKIVAGKADRVPVSLYAKIKVNDTVYTKIFNFRVSARTNEVNFYKLVQEISPLTITDIYSSEAINQTTYYLPNVGTYNQSTQEFSDYDYRTSFDTPVVEPSNHWSAYQDIDLYSIEYFMSTSQAERYPYLTISDLTNNMIYLNESTFSNYAQISIRGTFNDGEVYESFVNISISLGNDTQLLEKAFSKINLLVDDISILGNIINTRIGNGILNEKGDFKLPNTFEDPRYTLTYSTSSDIITISTNPDEDGYYTFYVNPEYFKEYETSVPINVHVVYNPGDNMDPIEKTKTLYITAPAALHIDDLGTISIFNSTKYQVINQLPNDEKANTDYSGTTYPSLNGYNYLLMRDILGDEYYTLSTGFNADSLYLEKIGYTVSDYAPGTETLTYKTLSSNDNALTDKDAYDFVRLLEWATGSEKKLASQVVSGTSNTILSNGQSFLTDGELSVIKDYFLAKTNNNTAVWNQLATTAMETAPGFIYDNSSLLEAIFASFLDEIGDNTYWENGTQSSYGKIYAKYLEIINRYATTTSTNEEPMSPAQEVYNSKFYYSITTAASTGEIISNATFRDSIPCKFYNANGELVSGYYNRYSLPTNNNSQFRWRGAASGNNQGVYAAAAKTNIASVDYYANLTGAPYYSDHTRYITNAELMVLKAFWLGAISRPGYYGNNNVLKEFNATSQARIANALSADNNGILPYPDYSASDFNMYGEAIINAFDACLVRPTYLASNGISLLIKAFYDNYNGTGYNLKEYGSETESPFVSKLIDGVPAVTNLDTLLGSLSYFKTLKTLNMIGNETLPIFLSDYSLATTFARLSLTNTNLESLTMQYVTRDVNDFDITNIKNFEKLETINISHNPGITSVNQLLNSKRHAYTSVNFQDIGEVYEYNKFAIDNLAYSCEVLYTDASGNSQTQAKKTTGSESILINLSDFDSFVTEHLFLTNVLYDENDTENVCWRIDEGNPIHGTEIMLGGDLEEIDSVREMNFRISPYFYCNANFQYDGYQFINKGLYKVVVNGQNVVVTPINIDNGNLSYEIEFATTVPSTDFENLSDNDPNMRIYPEHLKFSGEYSRTQTPTDTTDTIYSQDSTIVSNTRDYTLRFRYHIFSFTASRGDNTTPVNHYLSASGIEFNCTYGTQTNMSNYFVLMNQNQANFLVELRNNDFKNTTDAIMDKYGITATNNVITLGSTLPNNNNTPLNNYYIYNIYTQKFITVYGLDEQPISLFNVVRSGRQQQYVYTLYNQTNREYLAQAKVASNGANNPWDIGVIYYSSGTANDDFTQGLNGIFSLNRSYWQQYSTNTYDLGTVTCSENTPTLDITTGKNKSATAYFNCVYLASGSGDSGAINKKIYDTGIYLLITDDNSIYSRKGQFCFLSEDEKDRLESWYENPDEDITLGSTPENLGRYYIYCPYTRRFISGGATNNNGEIYKTVSDFNAASEYYIHRKSGNRYYITHSSLPTNNDSGFNSYGGVGSGAKFIALYHTDDNSTNIFQAVSTPYEISYSIKSKEITYIAYQVDYTVARVSAHIVERDIEKEYQFDKFYYLNQDVTINGVKYLAGNVIRFVCDAYYGKQYDAYIEYYELILTYYDDRYKTDDAEHKHVIYQFNTAEYTYYYYGNNNVIDDYEGEIIYNHYPEGHTFEKYSQSFTYDTHTVPTGITVQFPETKWIYTAESFNEIKSNLYLDADGAQSAANAQYNEGTTYYKPKYVVATLFADEFNRIKNTLYSDSNGTPVAANATFNKSAAYYVVGYSKINPIILRNIMNETYTSAGGITTTIEVPIYEYYKNGIYLDNTGTRVPLNATYNPNTTYYFLQQDGTYSTERPKYYSAIVADYVSLTLNATTFDYFKHTLYSNNTGTIVDLDAQYSSDITYYINDYVLSNFREEILDRYRNVLYRDSKGTPVDSEETFDPNITYYTNEFVNANITTQQQFNQWRNRLYADAYGLPLAANAQFVPGTTYYKRTLIVAEPGPTGNLEPAWVTTKNQVTRLYSHVRITNNDNFATYMKDYGNIYDFGGYPIIYKYTGTGSENIYADPTISVAYEPIRTGTVTADNFATMKNSLYDDINGTPLAQNAQFEPGKIYYVKTWLTVANIVGPNVSYDTNYGYYLTKDNTNLLEWNRWNEQNLEDTADTMDSILEEANRHFATEYGQWYGKYYGYNGFTMYSENVVDEDMNRLGGYDKQYIYRLVTNAESTGFIWQRVKPYQRIAGTTMVQNSSSGAAQAGDVIWATSTCFNGFYTGNKFYRIIDDDFTKTKNVLQFTDIDLDYILSGQTQVITDIQNKKIRYIRQGDYLGYACTTEIVLSAVIREHVTVGNVDYYREVEIRSYRIKFVGTVIMN